MRTLLLAALLLSAAPSVAAPLSDAAAVAVAKPRRTMVDAGLAPAAVAAMLRPIDAF